MLLNNTYLNLHQFYLLKSSRLAYFFNQLHRHNRFASLSCYVLLILNLLIRCCCPPRCCSPQDRFLYFDQTWLTNLKSHSFFFRYPLSEYLHVLKLSYLNLRVRLQTDELQFCPILMPLIYFVKTLLNFLAISVSTLQLSDQRYPQHSYMLNQV